MRGRCSLPLDSFLECIDALFQICWHSLVPMPSRSGSSVAGRLRSLMAVAPVLVLVLVLVCCGAGCSREAKRDRHLKRANSYYEARDYQKAAIEYLNALRL